MCRGSVSLSMGHVSAIRTATPRSRPMPLRFPNRVVIDRDGEAPVFAVAARSPGTPSRWSAALCGGPRRFLLRYRRPESTHTLRSESYPLRPRFRAAAFCGDPGGPAVLVSRINALRINSDRLSCSRCALSRRRWWISRASRNVTGTLPFGRFVLGMNNVYYCIIYHVNLELSCPGI